MEKESALKDLINSSLDKVRTIIDADTVVGKQIATPSGTVIIPVSKVSMGFASGGLDIPSNKKTPTKFGGGGGTGVTVNPLGFLVVSPAGKVDFLPMLLEPESPIEQISNILDQTPDLINRIKAIFSSDTDVDVEDSDELEEEYNRRIREKSAKKTN
ncbi:MAG: sporulation protein YtfJ [Clostridia bacterium]|nr:sporulation protein YtfJ [Clostridia bacterium]